MHHRRLLQHLQNPQIKTMLHYAHTPITHASEDIIFEFCSLLDPISLYYFSATSKIFRKIAHSNFLWKPILLKQFPNHAAMLTYPLQQNDFCYQIYRYVLHQSHQNLKLPANDKMGFTLVPWNDLSAIKTWKIQFSLDTLATVNNQNKELTTLVRAQNNPQLNKYIFLQNFANNTSNIRLMYHGICLNQSNQYLRQLLEKHNLQESSFLQVAVQQYAPKSAKLLIKLGSNINKMSNDTAHPLYLAAEMNQPPMVDLLIKKGAAVDLVWKSYTALCISVEKNNLVIIDKLLKANADVNINVASDFKKSPLFIAICHQHHQALKLLLPYAADLTPLIADQTIIHYCAVKNDIASLKILLNYIKQNNLRHPHCDVNTSDNKGITPLHTACQRGNLDMVKLLLEHGAQINQQTQKHSTALIISAKYGKHNIVSYLLRHGADPDLRLNTGFTALHTTCLRHQFNTALPIITALIHAGANASLISLGGSKPSRLARDRSIKEIMLSLETIYEQNINEIVSIEPTYLDDSDSLNMMFTTLCANNSNAINQALASIGINLLLEVSTPFGRAVILYAFLNCDFSQIPSFFNDTSNNQLSSLITKTIGFAGKNFAITALHQMLWNSVSANKNLFDSLQTFVINPIIKLLTKPDQLPPNHFGKELLCLSLYETNIKKDLAIKKLQEFQAKRNFG